MTTIINYIIDNHRELLGIATSVIAAASAIAAVTPTPADDKFVGKAYRIIDWLALNIGRAKD